MSELEGVTEIGRYSDGRCVLRGRLMDGPPPMRSEDLVRVKGLAFRMVQSHIRHMEGGMVDFEIHLLPATNEDPQNLRWYVRE